MAASTFNFKAKNFVIRKNDEINKLKRTTIAKLKSPANAKKCKNLIIELTKLANEVTNLANVVTNLASEVTNLVSDSSNFI